MSSSFFKYLPVKIIFCFLFPALHGISQNPAASDILTPPLSGQRCLAEVVNGDTIPLVKLETVYIYTDFIFKSPRHHEQWTRTKFNVKKVYPYAIIAAAKLKEYD